MPRRLEPGQEVDGFRLEERMHQGGMAVLWRVTHPAQRLPLVMKVPLIAYGEGPGPIVGFEVEQMILPRLLGPHVPRFVAAADFSEQPYIVMERLPGESLLPFVENAPLQPARVAEIGAKVAAALHDIHRQHVIHFDVKPSNVMTRESGEAVLIDFGLSRHDQLPDLLQEEFHLPLGTGPYISPEQVMGDRTDPRSDLFALGVMLYLFRHGAAAVRHARRTQGAAAALLARPRAPAPAQPGGPALAAGVDPALPGGRSGPAARQPPANSPSTSRHPDQVPLTARAERTAQDDFLTVARRRFRAARATPRPPAPRPVSGHLAVAPIVMAAVDLAPEMEALADALRPIVRRILAVETKARLACVNVLKTPRIGVDFGEDEQGRNLHVQRLVELKHWAHRARSRPSASPTRCWSPRTPRRRSWTTPAMRMSTTSSSARAAPRRCAAISAACRLAGGEAPCNVTVVRARPSGEALSVEAGAVTLARDAGA